MGNGSNLLVRDEGVRGMVVRVRRVMDEIDVDDGRWTVGAGASFPGLARRCADAGRTGLEFGTGIPGTLGGAIVMNAGWHEYEIRSVVREVRVVGLDGAIREVPTDRCGFDYRRSRFRGGRDVVVSAVLELEADRPEDVRARVASFADSRRRNQPTELASCGSVFLKPPGDFAGRLIDAAGLKGLRVGDLEVSPKHANFFVNHGAGTAADALELVERVEDDVFRRFGVRLVREFELW
jgi:UDP-N-acetylmuramate dehydrogenase